MCANEENELALGIGHVGDTEWMAFVGHTSGIRRRYKAGRGISFRVNNRNMWVEVWVTRSQSSTEPWIGGNGTPGFSWTGSSSDVSLERVEASVGGGYGSIGISSKSAPLREMTEVNEMTRLLPNLETAHQTPKQNAPAGRPSAEISVRPSSSSSFPLSGPIPAHTDRYLSPAVQRILTVQAGRADISSMVQQLADRTDLEQDSRRGRMVVVACGPVELMNCTRRAVAEVNRWIRIRAGGTEVEYMEETVGH